MATSNSASKSCPGHATDHLPKYSDRHSTLCSIEQLRITTHTFDDISYLPHDRLAFLGERSRFDALAELLVSLKESLTADMLDTLLAKIGSDDRSDLQLDGLELSQDSLSEIKSKFQRLHTQNDDFVRLLGFLQERHLLPPNLADRDITEPLPPDRLEDCSLQVYEVVSNHRWLY